MKTTYYISYEIKKSNGTKVWHESKHFDSMDDAHALFQAKVKDGRIQEAHLWKMDTWTDPAEIPFETTVNRRPDGWHRTNPVESYNPKIFGSIKIWDTEITND